MSGTPLCRDCLTFATGPAASRCTVCGSPRLLRHKERDTLSIAHVDCDAFFAAVEKRDNPSLADKPVIIGGGKRGVVATCCYVARTYGVRSAMPMFKALDACPHAVVVKPNMEKYRIAGREVRQLMLELTPLVEPVSIDEAFLDLSGTERLHHGSAAVTLARFVRRVEDEIGITISVGLSYNKFLAKIASDFEKPRGFSIIGREEAADFLADKPVSMIPGIGAAAQARLARAGITRIAHLRDGSLRALYEALGRDSQRLAKLAWGQDDRRVTPERETKSVSAETTFDTDLRSFDDLEPILWRLAEKVSRRLKAANLAGQSITLKLKDSEFRILTRTRSGLPPTQLAIRLFEPARQLLKASCDGTAFRLIGVGAADLCDAVEADRGDLADQSVVKQAHMESAIDKIRDKFGIDALQKGIALRRPQR
ncbi:DNA polymerase IV [Microvirga brassicacearum]|uniref:DNA polymerase IV n=1 Tax=Microvirga brassicacearum TaxID=2580413 RepID=A0A5N3PEP6_9HYPH|nr:DNA polymerase IV [Microvirga brassicacearum]KAB0268183.1 DNA polymerase IV [Microvirga brassicacearum]